MGALTLRLANFATATEAPILKIPSAAKPFPAGTMAVRFHAVAKPACQHATPLALKGRSKLIAPSSLSDNVDGDTWGCFHAEQTTSTGTADKSFVELSATAGRAASAHAARRATARKRNMMYFGLCCDVFGDTWGVGENADVGLLPASSMCFFN